MIRLHLLTKGIRPVLSAYRNLLYCHPNPVHPAVICHRIYRYLLDTSAHGKENVSIKLPHGGFCLLWSHIQNLRISRELWGMPFFRRLHSLTVPERSSLWNTAFYIPTQLRCSFYPSPTTLISKIKRKDVAYAIGIRFQSP